MENLKLLCKRLALPAILLLAAVLNFAGLGQNGFGNFYYAAAVKSMLMNWHNFFFNSYDPGGFVTVDKPPIGLWVQTLSAAIFGYKGLSLLAPQALAGIISVGLLYYLVKKPFGTGAGLLAALMLAITPMFVAVNRNNTMDSILVLVLLLAAWAVSIAAEKGSLKWLLFGMVLVGIGFNIKMLQAYMVLPAFYLIYLTAPSLKSLKKIGHIALATVVLFVVSLSWSIAVDMTPRDQRPYVGGSMTNSALELSIGYNGIVRILPVSTIQKLLAPPSAKSKSQQGTNSEKPQSEPKPKQNNPPEKGAPPKKGAGNETGSPGLFRLFNEQMAGQISWLLLLAILGLIAAIWQLRGMEGKFKSIKKQALLLWVVWMLPQGIFVSVSAGMFHRYYLMILAPAISALAGIGTMVLWDYYKQPGWRGWMLPITLLATGTTQIVFLSAYPQWSRWFMPPIVAICLLATVILVVLRLRKQVTSSVLAKTATAIGIAVLLILPTIWSAITLAYKGESMLPFAGPDLAGDDYRISKYMDIKMPKLVNYLLTHKQNEKFLVGVVSSLGTAPVIVETGQPIMTFGGFAGLDNILTVKKLEKFVNDGAIRYFVVPQNPQSYKDLIEWITKHGTPVPKEEWEDETLATGPMNGVQLYDCRMK